MSTDLETTGHARIEEIGPAACLALIGGEPIGRIVFVDDRQPIALPVTFTLDVGTVVFQSAPGSKLDKALRQPGARVAFEVDRYDAETQSGWSVLIKGTIHPVSGIVDTTRLQRFAMPAWATLGRHARWIRVEAEEITGRRVVPEPG